MGEKKDPSSSDGKFNDGGGVPTVKINEIAHGIRRCTFYYKVTAVNELPKPDYVSESAPPLYELQGGDETGTLTVRVPSGELVGEDKKIPKEGTIIKIDNATVVARRKIKVLLNRYGSLILAPPKNDIPKELTNLKLDKLNGLLDIGTVVHRKPEELQQKEKDTKKKGSKKGGGKKGGKNTKDDSDSEDEDEEEETSGKKGKKGFKGKGKKGKGKGKDWESGWGKGQGRKRKRKGQRMERRGQRRG